MLLGLVLPDSILVYNEFIQQLYRRATARDYELQIALSEFQATAEERAVRCLLEARVDGIVIRSHFGDWNDVPPDATLRQAAARGWPVVTFGPTLAGSPFPAIELPLEDRSHRATLHLLELGHRHLACLLPAPLPLFGPYLSAVKGVQTALRERDFDPEIPVVTLQTSQSLEPENTEDADADYGNYLHEVLPRYALGRGQFLLRRALELAPRPTGLVCYNAVIAIGVLQEAQKLGLRVPDDLSVVSITRGLVADLSPLSLTTCDVPPVDAATATLNLLFEALEGQVAAYTRRTVEPVLRVGEATVRRR